MTTTIYKVTGMTCGHCVNAVTNEVSGLAGVRDVHVDLQSGSVTVTSEGPLAQDDVRAAVQEAGYAITS